MTRPRQFSRSVLRSHVEELHRAGLFAEVRAIASGALGPLLDRPGDAPTWLDAAPFDELNALVYGLLGRKGLRELLRQVMKSGFSKVLEPIIQFALACFGGTPGSILSHADSLLAVNTRGLQMKWALTSARTGTMQVCCFEPVPPASWISWEGIFLHVVDLSGATGTVGEARPSADGFSCEIDVSWKHR